MATTRKNVTAATVRAWATEQGLPVGKRGVIAPEIAKAFAKANRGKVYEPKVAEHRTVTVNVKTTDSRGRNRTAKRTLSLAEARKVLGAEGKRGRISTARLAEALSER